jgi:hypothetical protein
MPYQPEKKLMPIEEHKIDFITPEYQAKVQPPAPQTTSSFLAKKADELKGKFEVHRNSLSADSHSFYPISESYEAANKNSVDSYFRTLNVIKAELKSSRAIEESWRQVEEHYKAFSSDIDNASLEATDGFDRTLRSLRAEEDEQRRASREILGRHGRRTQSGIKFYDVALEFLELAMVTLN